MRKTCPFLCVLVLLLACGGGGGGGDAPPAEAWRSQLFSADWTPDLTTTSGRFLHDVSYAGYAGGERPLPDSAGLPLVDAVAGFGADPSGATDSTAALQAALDDAPNQVVYLPAGLFRVDGLLTVTQAGVVLRGAGPQLTRLYFTRTDSMTGRDHLSFRGALSTGSEHVLARDAEARSFQVHVADATGLTPGTDVYLGWTISDEFIAEHLMTGTWQAFNGTWQVFLQREIVAVDTDVTPHAVTLDAPVRYPGKVRDGVSLRVVTGYLTEVGVEDLAVGNAVAWDDAWLSARVHAIGFDVVADGWVRNVHSFAPPTTPTSGDGAGDHLQNGGIFVKRSKRVTVAGCRMERAQNRGGGGCGYLFEILQCCEVLTRDCQAHAGRHNFIQNWGFGTTGCVWLRCRSTGGFAISLKSLPGIGQTGYSEYHHSLATANVVDACYTDDGWSACNRQDWSTGAGHSATQCVFWNTSGSGLVRSMQFGYGYVIGTGPATQVDTSLGGSAGEGSAPEDWREGIGTGGSLDPSSLYVGQFRLRIGRDPETAP